MRKILLFCYWDQFFFLTASDQCLQSDVPYAQRLILLMQLFRVGSDTDGNDQGAPLAGGE